MKIREVIEAILAYHPSLGEHEKETVDTVKYGDVEAECTGIVTTIAPSVEVIRKTAELGYNLIITHEPVFYTHVDNTDWLETNQVYKDKIALLEKHGIVVWRDHDHIHAHEPDHIFLGFAKEMGWDQYLEGDPGMKEGMTGTALRFKMPKTTVRKLAEEVKQKMGLNMLRVIGNLDAEIEKVSIVAHVYPEVPDMAHTALAERDDMQVIIPGELVDWTLASYVRDAAQLGYPKAILAVGHFNMEEPGMHYLEEWVPGVIGNAAPVKFISAGDMYQYL